MHITTYPDLKGRLHELSVKPLEGNLACNRCHVMVTCTINIIITTALLSFTAPPHGPLHSGPQVLTKMKQQGCETSNWPETEDTPLGGNGSWKNDLQKELSDIW